MYGCRTGKASFGSRPMLLSIVALSIALTSGPTGGKSTIRKIDPRGGGGTPIVRSARSTRPEMSAGVSSVTHKSVDVTPTPGRTVEFGALPSITTTPLPRSLWPVTTRLIGLFITSRPLALSAKAAKASSSTASADRQNLAPQSRSDQRHEIRPAHARSRNYAYAARVSDAAGRAQAMLHRGTTFWTMAG